MAAATSCDDISDSAMESAQQLVWHEKGTERQWRSISRYIEKAKYLFVSQLIIMLLWKLVFLIYYISGERYIYKHVCMNPKKKKKEEYNTNIARTTIK